MSHDLSAQYEGARLQLTFDEKPQASLYINGLRRDSSQSEAIETTLVLASPVQTGYEHHEIIEAKVSYTADKIVASLHSGDKLIADRTIQIGS